jgi:hypothetical protein
VRFFSSSLILLAFHVCIIGPDAFPFSVNELRLLTILQQIPFVIPFDTRVQVLNLLIHQNKAEQQHGAEFLQNGSTINIRIRRDYIYEDAFEKLSPENGKRTFVLFCFCIDFLFQKLIFDVRFV